MSRSVQWRRTASDTVSWRQDQGLNATIYIVREIGPTGFVLKEDGESKPVRVLLGDPHSCTCALFRKERDLCKHLCWLLLKKFRVSREDPISFQKGLVEREINSILRGEEARRVERTRPETARKAPTVAAAEDGRPALEQRDIGEDDVCPICQEELLGKHEPVTYCKYGCANSIHIKCMKIWAEHQNTMGEKVVKCPFCREDFGPYSYLREEYRNTAGPTIRQRVNEHPGTLCRVCNQSPITGKCYRCCSCREYHLCQKCFNTPTHLDHSFEFRQASNGRWRPAERVQTNGMALPTAIVNNLMERELGDNDYDLLLQLDDPSANELSQIPESEIKKLPMERVRPNSRYLAPGEQCCICLRPYQIGQNVKRLPCRHKFHKDCIDNWLLHQHPTCPVDGQVVWNPLTSDNSSPSSSAPRVRRRRPAQSNNQSRSNVQPADEMMLEIPGIGIARVQMSESSHSAPPAVHRRNSTDSLTSQPSVNSHELTSQERANNNQIHPSTTSLRQQQYDSHMGEVALNFGDLLSAGGATEHSAQRLQPMVESVARNISASSGATRGAASLPRHMSREIVTVSDSETENRRRRNRNLTLQNRSSSLSRRINPSVPSITTAQPRGASNLFLGNPEAELLDVVPPLMHQRPFRGNPRTHEAHTPNEAELFLGSSGQNVGNQQRLAENLNLMRRPKNTRVMVKKPPRETKHSSHQKHDSGLELAGTGMLALNL